MVVTWICLHTLVPSALQHGVSRAEVGRGMLQVLISQTAVLAGPYFVRTKHKLSCDLQIYFCTHD